MKKMNKYMKTTIITVIILALFTIAQRDKIIGYEELVSRIARLGIMPKQSK